MIEKIKIIKNRVKQLYKSSDKTLTLMQFQHKIVQSLGYRKWSDLLSLSQEELDFVITRLPSGYRTIAL